MSLLSDIVAFVAAAAAALVAPHTSPLERRIERTYQVQPGATVAVDLSGGAISVVSGTGRSAQITLIQRVHSASERAADEALTDYTIDLAQENGDIRLTARRKTGANLSFWRGPRVRMDAELSVPPDVRLDLDTSGGSIRIEGLRHAPVDANTSGGSITVDGSRAPIVIHTSGGSIRVGHVGDTLRARTSGGSVRVSEVASSAGAVEVSTAGGSIRVGVDPAARFDIDASTSGGSVSVDELALSVTHRSRTHVAGTLNGGGARLKASTSGGSVRIGSAGNTGGW